MNEKTRKLCDLVAHQLDTLFLCDYSNTKPTCFLDIVDRALNMTVEGLKIINPQLCVEGIINPYHSVSYCIFLYWMSRLAWLNNAPDELADKLYYLNKTMNCVELFYQVELPAIWCCQHPLGSIMGKASYGDFFYFYQGCTVGGNFREDGSIVYPQIGERVKMLSNSKIIGDCHVGNNVIISANAYIKDMDIPDNVIVFGSGKDIVLKKNTFKIIY